MRISDWSSDVCSSDRGGPYICRTGRIGGEHSEGQPSRTKEGFRIKLSFTNVIIGLSITASWGNGHATAYRALVRELIRRGHKVIFLERDVPWYAAERDLPRPPYGQT